MSNKILKSIRTSVWVLLAVVVAFMSWVFGIGTESAMIDGCTWADHNAAIIYLLGSLLSIVAFYVLHRLSIFDREKSVRRTRVFALLLVLPWLFGLLISGPATLGAINRGRQKRTMADMRQCAVALEMYGQAYGVYPETDDPYELRSLLLEFTQMPEHDGWRQPWRVQVTNYSYTIVSYGKCGKPDFPLLTDYENETTTGFRSDIVYANGEFVRWPEGIQAN
jgi:hypothetical protein